MNKIIVFLIAFITLFNGANAKTNPFFGDKTSQITFGIGQGVDSYALVPTPDLAVPSNMFQLTYSQPSEFFRLPGRINISAFKTIGYGKKYQYNNFEWDWQELSTEIFVLSQDFALYNTERFYFGPGLGLAMQGRQTKRLNTKMLFSFKLFAGYRITDAFNMELFTQHFSNGDAGDMNYSYNFYGLGFSYNF